MLRRLSVSTAMGRFLATATALFLAMGMAAAQQTAPSEFDEDQLKSFAQASLEVQEIQEAWLPRIEAAEGTEAKEALRGEAISEMTAAVQAEGLDVPTYNIILTAAQEDPELAGRIRDYQRELQ